MAAIWSAALMLEHLGEATAAADVMYAMESVSAEGALKTPDRGGACSTMDLARGVADRLCL
jgi:tartrate dehydrogenase/decarboxylase/D-malate dehydrogenase